MSIFDSIGKAFSNAGKAIATAVVDGGNLFVDGWKDVFSGDFQKGITEVGFGMAKCIGIPTPGITGDTYADIVGQASQWSLQQFQSTGQKQCYSTYEQHVKDELASQSIPWTDSMDGPLLEGAKQMSWINLDC